VNGEYLKIAELNGATLSLLQDTPVVTAPTYQGLGRAMSLDLAPLAAAQKDFMKTLDTIVQTTDTSDVACGVPATMADGKDTSEGTTVLTKTFCSLHLSNFALKSIANTLMPAGQVWTDPFGGLIKLGQTLINTALVAMGAAALLSSTVTSAGSAVFEFLTGNWGAAAATVAGHAIMEFLGTPILLGLLAILLPGITIAYVLPMIPWVMWMAGVMGWIILVCEAMIAVPLWMLAHMTFGGDGLHGRATEGWALLFNVVFRPTLMIFGLFLGYFVFDCMSWLIRTTFGIAAGFVLANGWVVSNFIGLATLLTIFVMMQVTAATVSFRMVALLPHHLPRLIGFSSAGRVDMEDFASRAALTPGNAVANETAKRIGQGTRQFSGRMAQLRATRAQRISGPVAAAPGADGAGEGGGGMDSTLLASTDMGRIGGAKAMPEYGALTGALMLGQQLESYRWEDHFKDMRATNQLIADYNVLRQQQIELVQRYNKLVEGYNKLHHLALESEAEKKKTASLVSQVTEENNQLVTERDKLQLDLASVKTELALLRSIDRKQNPEVYRFRED